MMSLTEIAAVGLFAIKVLESNLAAQASVYVIVSKHQKLRFLLKFLLLTHQELLLHKQLLT